MRLWLIAMITLGLVGIIFIGQGITGMVISQTCCTGDDCEPDNLCDHAKPTLQSPAGSQNFILLGALALLTAIFAYVLTHPKFHAFGHK